MLVKRCFINSSKYPLENSPVYRALLDAERVGCFELSSEEIFEQCKKRNETLSMTAIAANLTELLENKYVVKENSQILRRLNWENEGELAQHLATLRSDNSYVATGLFGLPLDIVTELPKHHPLTGQLKSAVETHVSHKLSIAVCDTATEADLLLGSLCCTEDVTIGRYMNILCTPTEAGVDKIYETMSRNAYTIARVLDRSQRPVDEQVHSRGWTRALSRRTSVFVSEESFLTPQLLYELLIDDEFGKKVSIIAERSLLGKSEGNLIKDLIELGFPACCIGEKPDCRFDDKHCSSYLVARTRRLATIKKTIKE